MNEDGTFRFVDGVTGGGRTFVGLSSFLTGVKVGWPEIERPSCYRPQRSCSQGNIFTPVCHSVHRGGVCLSACWDITPPGGNPPGADTPLGADTPPEQTPPGADTPQSRQQTPQSRHPPEQTPPQKQTPPGVDPPWSRHPQSRNRPQEQTSPQTPPLSRHPPGTDTPLGSRLRHTVNERPVRILLGCILV